MVALKVEVLIISIGVGARRMDSVGDDFKARKRRLRILLKVGV